MIINAIRIIKRHEDKAQKPDSKARQCVSQNKSHTHCLKSHRSCFDLKWIQLYSVLQFSTNTKHNLQRVSFYPRKHEVKYAKPESATSYKNIAFHKWPTQVSTARNNFVLNKTFKPFTLYMVSEQELGDGRNRMKTDEGSLICLNASSYLLKHEKKMRIISNLVWSSAIKLSSQVVNLWTLITRLEFIIQCLLLVGS